MNRAESPGQRWPVPLACDLAATSAGLSTAISTRSLRQVRPVSALLSNQSLPRHPAPGAAAYGLRPWPGAASQVRSTAAMSASSSALAAVGDISGCVCEGAS